MIHKIFSAAYFETNIEPETFCPSQTLRDWERHGIILPPDRGNRIMGRDARYSEFSLAECFAAHHLIKGDLSLDPNFLMFLPKFTLSQIADAAKAWRKNGQYLIEGYPIPPTQSSALKLPPQKTTKEPKLHPLNLSPKVWHAPHIANKTSSVSEAFRDFYMAAWIWAVSIGCELFLRQYHSD